MIDLDELDRLANAASPGPWCDRGFGSIQPESGGSLVAVTVTKGGCLPDYVENSAFIAAANPAKILALTAEVRRLRAEVELCEKLLADCREAAFSEADNPYLGAAVGCPQDVPAFVSWEIERLRAALSTPVLTSCALFHAEGAHHGAAETALVHGAPDVTVYYGEKRIYTTLADFCAAHPKEGV